MGIFMNNINEIKGSKRIKYIDSLKGFAMIFVVIGHIADGYMGDSTGSAYNVWSNIYTYIYSFHMYLFMMVSGFLFSTAYITENGGLKKDRVKKQIFNLLGVYVIFSIVMWLFKFVCGKIVNNSVSVKDILLIFGKTISPYWYLYVLIAFYLIFSVSKIRMLDDKIMLTAAFVLGLLSMFVNINNWFEIKRIMYYLLFFAMGVVYQRNRKSVFFSKGAVVIMIVVSAAMLPLLSIGDMNVYLKHTVKFLCAIGLSVMFFAAFEHIEVLSKVWIFNICGKYCLEIYVIHCIFTAAVRIVMDKVGIVNIPICLVANLLISTAAPIIISIICRKLNIHELFFKPYSFIKERINK